MRQIHQPKEAIQNEVYVGPLSAKITYDQLASFFSKFGKISRIEFITIQTHQNEILEAVVKYHTKKRMSQFYNLDLSHLEERAFCHNGKIENRNLQELLFETSRKIFVNNISNMNAQDLCNLVILQFGIKPLDCMMLKVRCGVAPENCAYLFFRTPIEVQTILNFSEKGRIFSEKFFCFVDVDFCDPDKDEIFRYRLREKKRRKKRKKRLKRVEDLEERIRKKKDEGSLQSKAYILQVNKMESGNLDKGSKLMGTHPARNSVVEDVEISHLKPCLKNYWNLNLVRRNALSNMRSSSYFFRKG